MNISLLSFFKHIFLGVSLMSLSLLSHAEDIDLFVGSSAGSTSNANVLIIVDNTSNWSQLAQQWPGGIAQGQSELRAISQVVGSLNANVNVGLMMFTDSGSGNVGGYIRYAIRPMTSSNKSNLLDLLTTIYTNFGTPSEKVASSAPYGNALFDAFKYFGGFTSPLKVIDQIAGSPTDKTHFGPIVFNDLTPTTKSDASAYTDGSFGVFSSPISTTSNCGKNYIIFIGNGFPNADSTTWLSNVEGDTASLAVPGFTTSTTTLPGVCTDKGYSDTCSRSNNPSTSPYSCVANETIKADLTRSVSSGCGNNRAKYMVQCCTASTTTTTVTPTNTYAQPSKLRTADEWTQFLYQTDVSSAPGQQNVVSYTIDVFNAQQDADQTALLMSMAHAGGGKYFAAVNENKIIDALKEIFIEIQSVNSAFASASLPVNATNRGQNENQVFIGMFRPDPNAKPRWFGNLKRYQLIPYQDNVELGDVNANLAVNPLTGFITECAKSYWTTDSGSYWQNIPLNPSPASACPSVGSNKFSDAPDGTKVEKGAVAEVIRKGNNPPTTNTTPTWTLNRTIYTQSGESLTAFTAASSGLSSSLVNFIQGKDVFDENANAVTTNEVRPSVHGDVIHSRPLPVNYGGTTGIIIYYGANDGAMRAVDAGTGRERWAFIAPEFFSRLSRLMDNSPLINYPNMLSGITPAPASKDYFFDGSMGVYQTVDNSKVWIFPTMRRGGRMIYAMDVTDPDTPMFKWKAGCPNLTNDTNCISNMSEIGQTWSSPSVAFLKGYSTDTPVLIMGGGYDVCEDANTVSPSCNSPKGNRIYILNANTGQIVRTFTTTRSVAADVALVDIDNDTYPDYAYAADTGGKIYRIDFIDSPITKNTRNKDQWSIAPIAQTSGAGRKFLFAPALFANSNAVYVAIGSGDREHPLQTNYPYTTNVVNRFYVYKDDLLSTSTKNLDTDLADFTTMKGCNEDVILPQTEAPHGWFMNLNQYGQGEQTVTSALIVSGMVTFSTNRPLDPAIGQCTTSLGEARGYWVNLLNGSGAVGVQGNCGGTRSGVFTGGGLPPSPVLASGVPVGDKTTTVVIGAIKKDGGSSCPFCAQGVKPTISSKRKKVYSSVSGDN